MPNQSYPGWTGPIGGAVVGALLGLGVAVKDNNGEIAPVTAALLGAGIGVAAGLIVLVWDWLRKSPEKEEEDSLDPRRRRD